eukprot:m.355210 g.355210  ORF g.355210 m.355210 type:complete len:89 (+) comp17197_c0_seq1:1625-1891(+)
MCYCGCSMTCSSIHSLPAVHNQQGTSNKHPQFIFKQNLIELKEQAVFHTGEAPRWRGNEPTEPFKASNTLRINTITTKTSHLYEALRR